MSRLLRQVEAVLFDMDGTLFDSEGYTERAIAALVRQRGLRALPLDPSRIHGVTWQQIAAVLVEIYPQLSAERMASELQRRFHTLLHDEPPPLVTGAGEAVARASRALPTALVSSSNRQSVELLMGQRDLLRCFRVTICAEDCTRSKPDPQCYVVAAQRLGCAVQHCLVFEDSLAGLHAAKAAGMTTVAITGDRRGEALQVVRSLADACIDHFDALAPDFFSTIKEDR